MNTYSASLLLLLINHYSDGMAADMSTAREVDSPLTNPCIPCLLLAAAAADHSALQRYVRMPDTAGEAFYQAAAELYLGTAAGVAGLLLDPAAGMRLPGALGIAGVMVGLLKGTGGLMVRPVMGAIDASSKCLKGVGLLCLGRRGIQGKLVRRVRAPGALEGPSGGLGPAGALAAGRQRAGPGADGMWLDDASLHAALVASWQARLPALASELEGDTVMDVLATRSCRLLLLTRKHVLYLRAKLPTRGQNAGSCSYNLRWLLPCERVDHVRGAEDSLRIILEFHTQLRVPDIKAWRQRRAAAAAASGGSRGAGAARRADGRAARAPAAAASDSRQQQQLLLRGGSAAGSGGDGARVLLRLPLHRSLRCASLELYQQVIRAISRHLVQAEAATAAAVESAAAAATTAGVGPPTQQQLALAKYGSDSFLEGGGGACQGRPGNDDYADLYSVG